MKKKFLLLCIMFVTLFLATPVYAEECSKYFDTDFLQLCGSVFKLLKIAAPVILLLLTTLDFGKVVILGEKDGLKKAKDNFVKRAIVAVIIFFIPDLIDLAFGLINEVSITDCIDAIKSYS